MGTNYYLHRGVCSHCKRSDPPLHIGKSSGGWCFGLHIIPDLDINKLEDWKKLWEQPDNQIVDEYGREISIKEMMDIIANRKWEADRTKPPSFYHSWEEFYSGNHAKPGPNGLVRLAYTNCKGDEGGTWDLIEGEFS